MTRPPGAVTYAAVLRTPGAAPAFAAASLTRLSYGTVGLSLLLTVQQSTGSYGVAGSAVAAFGLPSLLLPVKARLVDRHGRRAVLVPLAVAYGAVLLVVAALGTRAAAPAAAFPVLALAAGVLAPPAGPVMRTVWAALTPEPAARQRAYSLDAVSEECLFVLGPVLVGLLAALVDAWAALVLTGVLALVGSVALATAAPPARPAGVAREAGGEPGRPGPLRSARFRWLLLVLFVLSVALSPLELAVVARATELGNAAAAGPVLAVLSVGSALGGLLWGRRVHARPHEQQLLCLLLLVSGGLVLAGTTGDLRVVAVALGLTGLAVAPVFVVAYVAADGLVPPRMRTEATTWVATAANLGGSLGVSGAGFLLDGVSPQTALLLAGAALAGTVPLLAAGVRRAASGAGADGTRTAPIG